MGEKEASVLLVLPVGSTGVASLLSCPSSSPSFPSSPSSPASSTMLWWATDNRVVVGASMMGDSGGTPTALLDGAGGRLLLPALPEAGGSSPFIVVVGSEDIEARRLRVVHDGVCVRSMGRKVEDSMGRGDAETASACVCSCIKLRWVILRLKIAWTPCWLRPPQTRRTVDGGRPRTRLLMTTTANERATHEQRGVTVVG